jgi:N-hydroxyarylamine O-acetyltransferase
MTAKVDLQAYLDRIGYTGSVEPTLATLSALMRAHMIAIPFEALDVLLGRGIRLDLQTIQAKLIGARRGGYCYEHVTLFAAALEALGFKVFRHSARVVLFTPLEESPTTHMFVTVDLPEGRYVADPGFGGPAATVPVPMSGEVVGQHQITQHGALWAMMDDGRPAWYSPMEVDYPIDFEMGNHFVATHPNSPFVQFVMMSRFRENGRVSVMNRDVKIIEGDETRTYQLRDKSALRAFLVEHFGFDLPEAETLRVPAIPEWG